MLLQIPEDIKPVPPASVKHELRALWNDGWNKDDRKRPDMARYLSRLETIARG